MKLIRYKATRHAAINNFQIDGLAETVVLAGPNGVGKTTLLNGLLLTFQNPGSYSGTLDITVEATNPEERTLWGNRSTLNSQVQAEANILRGFLQRNQKRGSLKGCVLNFDSARAFEQINPYNWSFQFADPFEELVGWNQSFTPTKGRFQEVIHSLVRKVRSQKEEIANRGLAVMKSGGASLDLTSFGDPLLKFKDAFERLLPGKKMLDINEQDQAIKYQAGGQTLMFANLSSGEREVVTVVFDFLLRSPKDCIVVFDEPELHLHPELSYRLLRTLQEVGERNQFIFCTHSPEIITAALEQTVVFVSPSKTDGTNQALKVEENDDVSSVLRALGQSVGVISLGRKIVLIEGDKNSLDKETYGSIIGSNYPNLVLVPNGGKDAIGGFQKALETVLSKTIWGVDFFMLCDGDSTAQASGTAGNRLKRLPRYHLENYFLDERVWVEVFADLAFAVDHEFRDSAKVRQRLRSLAREHVSYAVALKVSHQLRQAIGNVDLMPKGCDSATVDELCLLFEGKRTAEAARCANGLEKDAVEKLVRETHASFEKQVAADSEEWKALVPGKPIVKRFASSVQQEYGTLKRLYIRAAARVLPDPFSDIRSIFAGFEAA